MDDCLIFPAGSTQACQYAATYLSLHNIALTQQPSLAVTHILLDVPSFQDDGLLRNGSDICALLSKLPDDCVIIGGNLKHPALTDRTVIDLLQNENYICKNAAITAHCALAISLQHLKTTLPESSALIIGWGRIGKCLANLLSKNGCFVWVMARNPKDRAIARALGYGAVSPDGPLPNPGMLKLIFNTAPQKVLSREQLMSYTHCIQMDLASVIGLDSPKALWARGLPGKYAPESSGKLIAQTIMDHLSGGSL